MHTSVDKVHGNVLDNETLRDNGSIVALLEEAAAGIQAFDVYRHENGFVKIVLKQQSDAQVRVHVWDDLSLTSAENIHSHRHPISSRLVVGALEEGRWVPSVTGTRYRRYHFAPRPSGQQELSEDGFIVLQPTPTPTHTRRAGDVYHLPMTEFHAVRALSVPTITVFSQDLRVRSEGFVASEYPLTARSRPTQMAPSNREAVQVLLSQAVSRLSHLEDSPKI